MSTTQCERTMSKGEQRGAPLCRRVGALVNVALVLVAVCYYVSTFFVVLNVEPSVPVGLWRLHVVEAPLTRGVVVRYLPPAATWPWHPWWVAFLKPVAGIAGDVACVDEEGLWVRDEWYGPVVREAAGQVLPHIDGCVIVGVGEVFVASRHARSLDARYHGSVAVEVITHIATPLWTWR